MLLGLLVLLRRFVKGRWEVDVVGRDWANGEFRVFFEKGGGYFGLLCAGLLCGHGSKKEKQQRKHTDRGWRERWHFARGAQGIVPLETPQLGC